MVSGRQPLVEDDLMWKTTFSGRQPSVKDNFQCKMTLGGRGPSVEDDLCWKTTFGGRRPLVEDDLLCKTTFGGRRLLVEDNPWMLPGPLCRNLGTRALPAELVKFLIDQNNVGNIFRIFKLFCESVQTSIERPKCFRPFHPGWGHQSFRWCPKLSRFFFCSFPMWRTVWNLGKTV